MSSDRHTQYSFADEPLKIVSRRLNEPIEFWSEHDAIKKRMMEHIDEIMTVNADFEESLGDSKIKSFVRTSAKRSMVRSFRDEIGEILETGEFSLTRAKVDAYRDLVQWLGFKNNLGKTKYEKGNVLESESNIKRRTEISKSMKPYLETLEAHSQAILKGLDALSGLCERYDVIGHRVPKGGSAETVSDAFQALALDGEGSGTDGTITWDRDTQTGTPASFWEKHAELMTQLCTAANSFTGTAEGLASLILSFSQIGVAQIGVAQDGLAQNGVIDENGKECLLLAGRAVKGTCDRATSVLKGDYVARSGKYRVSRQDFKSVKAPTEDLATRLRSLKTNSLLHFVSQIDLSQVDIDADLSSKLAMIDPLFKNLYSEADQLETACSAWKTFLEQSGAFSNDE